jgi:hypothetical protein
VADQDSFSKAIPIRVVSVDSNGVPLPAGGSAVTIADNGNAVEGALADAAITTNATGSLSGKLRGIVALLAGGIAATVASTTLTATVNPAGVAAVVSGRQVVVTAGTSVQLSTQACKSVAITAGTANTGIIVVGDSAVVAAVATRKGTPLSAGDTLIAGVSNMNLLYMDATVSGEGVTWMVLN